jgi:hypothetical protein
MGLSGQCHAPPALPPGNDTVPIVKEAGWASKLILWRNSRGNHSAEDLEGPRISLDTVQK